MGPAENPPRGGEGSSEERVRPCLECGTILPFNADACSLCGTRMTEGGAVEEAVKPCMACEALISEEDIFCPECGDFALRVSTDSQAAVLAPLGTQAGQAVTVLARALSVLVAVLALAVLVAVLVEAFEAREVAASF